MVACCPLEGSDEGGPQVYETLLPRARKVHRCTECGDDIPVGAKHEHFKGCWDGRWDSHRTCLSCVEIRDHFACNGYIFGQVWNDIEENFFPDMKCGGPCMEGLSPEAKARLIALRMEWLFDRGEEPNDHRWTEFGKRRDYQRYVPPPKPIPQQMAEEEEERKRWFDYRDAQIRRHLEWDPELEFYHSLHD